MNAPTLLGLTNALETNLAQARLRTTRVTVRSLSATHNCPGGCGARVSGNKIACRACAERALEGKPLDQYNRA